MLQFSGKNSEIKNHHTDMLIVYSDNVRGQIIDTTSDNVSTQWNTVQPLKQDDNVETWKNVNDIMLTEKDKFKMVRVL